MNFIITNSRDISAISLAIFALDMFTYSHLHYLLYSPGALLKILHFSQSYSMTYSQWLSLFVLTAVSQGMYQSPKLASDSMNLTVIHRSASSFEL